MQEITSLRNPKIQHVRKLKDRAYRRECGQFFVEGENLIKDLPDYVSVTELYVIKDRIGEYSYLFSRYDDSIICAVDGKVMKAISETVTPSGILAVVKARIKAPDLSGDLVVTDGIGDPGNMGTIIRTCVACGIKQIITVDSVDCYSGKVLRASMGGVFQLNINQMAREEAISKLNEHAVYALDMKGKNIFGIKEISHPFALIVGSESRGISDDFAKAGMLVSLPMKGGMESLNAAVSLSTALYEFVFNKA